MDAVHCNDILTTLFKIRLVYVEILSYMDKVAVLIWGGLNSALEILLVKLGAFGTVYGLSERYPFS